MFTISCPPKVVWLGREGENEFRTIEVEVSEWLREYPNGTISVVYHRPDDSIYMPTVTTSGNITRWLITSTDTSFTGRGEAEFRIIDGDIIGKSVKMPTMVSDGINAATDDPDSAPADWTVEAGRLQNEIDDLDNRVTELEEHGGGGEGTSDHRQLTNRDAANQHPISAITGLQSALDGKQASGDYATSGELDALADIVDGKADAADIPSLAGYATEAYVQNYHDNTKQDIITDLATIRSGAALGATALQSVPNTYALKTDIPTAEINANTAARHTHGNKALLDKIAEGGIGYTEGEATTIEWDGDTSGLVSVADSFYKVANYTAVTKADLISCIVSVQNDDTHPTPFVVEEDDINDSAIPHSILVSDYVIFVSEPTSYGPFNFEESGIYFGNANDIYTKSLTYTANKTIHKIDTKYLPIYVGGVR